MENSAMTLRPIVDRKSIIVRHIYTVRRKFHRGLAL
jgi:hypothetical protein